MSKKDRACLLIENLPDGFAYHQIITDSSGKPEDYIFLDVNPAFEQMTGLSRVQVVGKKATELHPGIENYSIDWIGTFGKVALTRESIHFEHYFDVSDRWYEITTCSDEPGYFAVFFRDITEVKEAEQKLTIFKASLESSKDAVGMSTPQGRHYYQNKAFGELFGTVGESPPETLFVNKKTGEEVFRTIMSGKEWEGEVKMYAKDGQVLDIHLQAFPNKDDNGNITELLGIHTDITKRKREKDELRKSEEKYRLLSENASDIIWTTDLDLNYTYISPSAEHISGYTVEEIMSLSVHDILTPSSLEQVLQVIQNELEQESSKKANPNKTRTVELEQYRKDGSTVWVEVNASFLFDQDGLPYGLLGITRDISDRKKVEESLKASEVRYRLLVENIGDIVFSVTDQGVFTYISPNCEAILGYKATEFVGKSFVEFTHPDDISIIYSKLQEVIEKYKESSGKFTEQVTAEYRARHKSGQWRWVSAKSTMLKAISSGYEMVSVARDITEQKENEIAVLESEAKHRRLFETMTQGIIYQAADETIISVNPAGERLLGLTKDQMQGKTSMDPFWQMIEEDGTVVPGTEHPTMIALRTGKKVGPVTRGIFHPDKRDYVWLNIMAIPLFQPGETEPFQVYATFEDITERKQAESNLKKILNEHETIFQGTQDAMFLIKVIDSNTFQYIRNNQTHAKLTGITVELIETKTPQELVGDELGDKIAANYRRCVSASMPIFYEETLNLNGVSRIWHTTLTPIFYENKIPYIVGSSQDVTDRKKAEQDLKESELRWNFALEGAGDGVWDWNAQSNEVFYSQQWKKMLGYEEHEIGSSLEEWEKRIHPEDKSLCYDNLNKHFSGETSVYQCEHRILCKDGTYKWILDRGKVIQWTEEGKPLRVIGTHSDITERKQAEEKIRYMSFHDSLTGLYNRYYLEEEMKRLDTQRQLPISIIMTDVNGLKLVNDTYGHSTGDQMLIQAAQILKRFCREDDIIARWGGDEFVILLPRTKKDKAWEICKRINNECCKDYVKGVPVSMATGVSSKDHIEKDLARVLREAEDHMYRHKLTESRSVRSAVLNSLLKTLGEKSYETEAHTRRMQEVALKIGEKIDLPDSELSRLNLLITLHDIGKINIPGEVLTKKGPLTKDEWKVIEKHPETGSRIARATDEFGHVAEDILAHHECWDGTGYPQGLKREEIPLLARITAVADAYEVMTNGRPYKKAMSPKEVAAELSRCAGTQFDPKLVDVILSVLEEQAAVIKK